MCIRDRSNGFKVKPSEIQNIITDKTKILVLNYPSNPTGVSYTKEELVEIADLAEKNDLIIISDEIYDKTLYSETKHTSFVQINDSIKIITANEKENTSLLNSLSAEEKAELMDKHLKEILMKLSEKST